MSVIDDGDDLAPAILPLRVVPLPAAARRLNLSNRSLHSAQRRKDLGLVDASKPPSGGALGWVTQESLDRVAAARDAVRRALRGHKK